MGAIVAYSVTDRDSFNSIQKWLNQVKDHADPNCALILLANKCDVQTSERQVSVEEGNTLAHELGLKLFEVSALNNQGIDTAMEHLAQMIAMKYEKISTPASSAADLDFPKDKERMSVGTDASAFTFKLDYTSTGRFDCCMARDKSLGHNPD